MANQKSKYWQRRENGAFDRRLTELRNKSQGIPPWPHPVAPPQLKGEKRAIANRLNAQKSTGPRTAEGKAAVRHNAVTHGLTAKTCLLSGESEEDYLRFAEELDRDLKPIGALENELASRVCVLAWRVRRVPAFEAMLYQHFTPKKITKEELDELKQYLEVGPGETAGSLALLNQKPVVTGSTVKSMLEHDFVGKLARYESHLLKQYSAALRALEFRQAERRASEAKAIRMTSVTDITEKLEPETRTEVVGKTE